MSTTARTVSPELLDDIRAKISDAYYEARNRRDSMDQAARDAVAAIEPILRSVDENAYQRGLAEASR